jgi:hypothetical protein
VGRRFFGPNVQQSQAYNFEPEKTTRKFNINHLECRLNLGHCRPTQVVNVAYFHLHHHNTNTNMPTKKRKHNKSDNRNNKKEKGMPKWTCNQRMNTWVTLTKTMQLKVFKDWISIHGKLIELSCKRQAQTASPWHMSAVAAGLPT